MRLRLRMPAHRKRRLNPTRLRRTLLHNLMPARQAMPAAPPPVTPGRRERATAQRPRATEPPELRMPAARLPVTARREGATAQRLRATEPPELVMPVERPTPTLGRPERATAQQ